MTDLKKFDKEYMLNLVENMAALLPVDYHYYDEFDEVLRDKTIDYEKLFWLMAIFQQAKREGL